MGIPDEIVVKKIAGEEEEEEQEKEEEKEITNSVDDFQWGQFPVGATKTEKRVAYLKMQP